MPYNPYFPTAPLPYEEDTPDEPTNIEPVPSYLPESQPDQYVGVGPSNPVEYGRFNPAPNDSPKFATGSDYGFVGVSNAQGKTKEIYFMGAGGSFRREPTIENMFEMANANPSTDLGRYMLDNATEAHLGYRKRAEKSGATQAFKNTMGERYAQARISNGALGSAGFELMEAKQKEPLIIAEAAVSLYHPNWDPTDISYSTVQSEANSRFNRKLQDRALELFEVEKDNPAHRSIVIGTIMAENRDRMSNDPDLMFRTSAGLSIALDEINNVNFTREASVVEGNAAQKRSDFQDMATSQLASLIMNTEPKDFMLHIQDNYGRYIDKREANQLMRAVGSASVYGILESQRKAITEELKSLGYANAGAAPPERQREVVAKAMIASSSQIMAAMNPDDQDVFGEVMQDINEAYRANRLGQDYPAFAALIDKGVTLYSHGVNLNSKELETQASKRQSKQANTMADFQEAITVTTSVPDGVTEEGDIRYKSETNYGNQMDEMRKALSNVTLWAKLASAGHPVDQMQSSMRSLLGQADVDAQVRRGREAKLRDPYLASVAPAYGSVDMRSSQIEDVFRQAVAEGRSQQELSAIKDVLSGMFGKSDTEIVAMENAVNARPVDPTE